MFINSNKFFKYNIHRLKYIITQIILVFQCNNKFLYFLNLVIYKLYYKISKILKKLSNNSFNKGFMIKNELKLKFLIFII